MKLQYPHIIKHTNTITNVIHHLVYNNNVSSFTNYALYSGK